MPNKTQPLISIDKPLNQLDTSPPLTGSGVWITSTTKDITTYRALICRQHVADVVKFIVQIIDPPGRAGERLTTIASGPVDPDPDITDVAAQKIVGPPPETILVFASNVPLKAPIGGPYRVKVTATPPLKTPPLKQPRPLPKKPKRRELTIDMPVGDVPLMPPAIPVQIAIYRDRGVGPKITYHVICFVPIVQFEIVITAHDGRFASKIQVVN
jgi:hypothetical protein